MTSFFLRGEWLVLEEENGGRDRKLVFHVSNIIFIISKKLRIFSLKNCGLSGLIKMQYIQGKTIKCSTATFSELPCKVAVNSY